MDENGLKVLILEATTDSFDYFLIILYSVSIEREELTSMKNLHNLLKDFKDFDDEKMIFAGDFNR